MKNKIENKARFFALYWNQDVLSSNTYGEDGTIYSLTMKEDSQKDCWLSLTPLSAITDEDAKHLGTTSLNIIKNSVDVSPKYMFYSEEADYLRSKGYAVPWMGLRVETMVDYGWIKFKE